MNNEKKSICVAGASGVVGSNLVKEGLAKGYNVRGTCRDINNLEVKSYLNKLSGAEKRLELFQADMIRPNSFDDPLHGVDCVFIACLIPTFFGSSGKPAKEMEYDQAYAEIISPTVNGCINILESARKNSVKNVVVCSSTSSTNPSPSVSIKNESHWSNERLQCQEKKYTSAAKTFMEKAAIKFAGENSIRLSIIMPTGLFGPVIFPSHMKGNPHAWISSLIRGKRGRHTDIPNDSTSLIHLEDLAKIFFAAYENPDASGRFYGVFDSWHWQDIYMELQKHLPDMIVPNIVYQSAVDPTRFDFTRRNSLGVSLRDIPTCIRETVDWIKSDPFK